MKIFVINGLPRSGKDTFVEFCQKHCNWCLNVSTVDFVKKVANYCGWDGTKTPENRKFLSDLKDLLSEWDDIPYKKVYEEIILFQNRVRVYDFDPDTDAIAFIHCREPKEIERLCKELGAQSLLITRGEVENNEQSNHADSEVFNYNYDYIISNDNSLQDLEDAAVRFLTGLKIKHLK
jgi:dephospho-CoA kinase